MIPMTLLEGGGDGRLLNLYVGGIGFPDTEKALWQVMV